MHSHRSCEEEGDSFKIRAAALLRSTPSCCTHTIDSELLHSYDRLRAAALLRSTPASLRSEGSTSLCFDKKGFTPMSKKRTLYFDKKTSTTPMSKKRAQHSSSLSSLTREHNQLLRTNFRNTLKPLPTLQQTFPPTANNVDQPLHDLTLQQTFPPTANNVV